MGSAAYWGAGSLNVCADQLRQQFYMIHRLQVWKPPQTKKKPIDLGKLCRATEQSIDN